MSPKTAMAVALVAIALLLLTAAISGSLPVLLAAVGGVFAGMALMGSVFHLRADQYSPTMGGLGQYPAGYLTA